MYVWMWSDRVGVEEQEVLELIVLHIAVFADIQFLHQRPQDILLGWDLQFDQHRVQLIIAKVPIFVDIELVKDLFKDELLMGAFCHLVQLESDYPEGLFDLFCGQGWLDFVFVVPLFSEEFGECGITDYVEA